MSKCLHLLKNMQKKNDLFSRQGKKGKGKKIISNFAIPQKNITNIFCL